MLDRNQIDTELIYMPENVRLEDAATWMQIMKTGVVAYGLDEILTITAVIRELILEIN